VGADDVAFHRKLFELDRVNPITVMGVLWELQREASDSATARVAGWARTVFGMTRYQSATARRGVEAARLAAELSCPLASTVALGSMLEHWDGSGFPGKATGQRIPIGARIVAPAQIATIWGEEAAPGEVAARLARLSGSRFDPTVVAALRAALAAEQVDAAGAWVDRLAADLAPHCPASVADQTLSPATVARVFADIVDSKSPFTASHSQRVAALAGAMARLHGATGAPEAEVVLAGLLHDLGKLAVPNTILDKPGPLDPPEWAVLRQHPADSARVIGVVPGWARLAAWAGAHHERPDGRGYHQGLAGAAIPLVGCLLAAADAFDAMTADRPYRRGLPIEEALRRLREGRETQFDPLAVDLIAAVATGDATGDAPPDLRASA
jgi:HD-GYP domain-containing protein (c-di-GMP phosphodiesterase class II)